MSITRSKNDPSPQKGIRLLLFLQIGAVVTALGLSFLDLFSPALAISFLMFIVLTAILHWLHLHPQRIPMVQKKRELERKSLHLQQNIRAETLIIQTTKKKREELFEAEKNEIDSSLSHLQHHHMQSGLADSLIKAATIPGVGPELQEGLAAHGIVSAAQVGSNLSEIPGLDEARRQALSQWRNRVFAGLESTKPDSLPEEQLERIKRYYQSLHEQNNQTALDAEARTILWNIRKTHRLGIHRRP